MAFILSRNASGTFYQVLGSGARETFDISRAHRFETAEEAAEAGRQMCGFWSVQAAPEPAADDGPKTD